MSKRILRTKNIEIQLLSGIMFGFGIDNGTFFIGLGFIGIIIDC